MHLSSLAAKLAAELRALPRQRLISIDSFSVFGICSSAVSQSMYTVAATSCDSQTERHNGITALPLLRLLGLAFTTENPERASSG